MTLLVDTSVWSLAFRRDSDLAELHVEALRAALNGADAFVTTGFILRELLHGFAGPKAHKELVEKFAALPMLMPDRKDYIDALIAQLSFDTTLFSLPRMAISRWRQSIAPFRVWKPPK